MENNERNYGIDLFRITLTLMICFLHVLNKGGGLDYTSGLSNKILNIISIICYGAVDGYALISGYVYQDNNNKLKKLLYLWIEVLFYSILITALIRVLFKDLTIINLDCLTPITSCYYWYMTAYFPLFLLMPYIARIVDNINKENLNKLFILLLLLFSIIPVLFKDNYTNNGYSFLWLLIMFIEGLIIRRNKLFGKMKNKTLIICCIFCILFVAIWWFFVDGRFVNYISPFIVFFIMFLLVLFSRIKFKKKTTLLVRRLSTYTLGIYLFQCNDMVWDYFIDNMMFFLSNINSCIVIIGYVILFSILLFLIGLFVDFIRLILFNIFKVDKISEVIANKLMMLFDKVSTILN